LGTFFPSEGDEISRIKSFLAECNIMAARCAVLKVRKAEQKEFSKSSLAKIWPTPADLLSDMWSERAERAKEKIRYWQRHIVFVEAKPSDRYVSPEMIERAKHAPRSAILGDSKRIVCPLQQNRHKTVTKLLHIKLLANPGWRGRLSLGRVERPEKREKKMNYLYRQDRKAWASPTGKTRWAEACDVLAQRDPSTGKVGRAYSGHDDGRGRYRKWAYDSWVLTDSEVALLAGRGITLIEEGVADAIADKRCRAGKQAAATSASRDAEIAESLGMPPDARTAKLLRSGEITRDQAERIAESCRHRHEDTQYDALLRAGVSRDDAREIIRVG
jgi:hypothetical protein